MNEKWTDFEKHVFGALDRIERRMTRIEIRTAVIAAAISYVMLLAKSHGLF